MKDVVTYGTGKLCKFQDYNMTVAGKTGTTSKYLDTWFVGFTPYYTAGIWSGYDTKDVSQTDHNYHKKLWRTIMEEIHKEKQLESADFPMPNSIETATICTKSGKLSVDGLCNHSQDKSSVKVEYFAKGTVPTEKCDIHKSVKICKESGLLATEFCPEDDIEEKVFLDKTETSPTLDTPYLIPTKECPIHDAFNTDEETPEIDDTIPEDPMNPTLPEDPIDVPIKPTQKPEKPSPKPEKPDTPITTPEITLPPVSDEENNTSGDNDTIVPPIIEIPSEDEFEDLLPPVVPPENDMTGESSTPSDTVIDKDDSSIQ